MVILALDQATKTSGYSVFTNSKLTEYGTINSDHDEPNTLERIKQMQDGIDKLIDRIHPDVVVLENIQFQRNIATFKFLAFLIGGLTYRLNKDDIPYYFIEPTAWKSFCRIHGSKREEQKKNTQKYVKNKYKVDCTEDEADSIGIGTWAICNIKENK